jgi:hypothetical protein
MTDQEPQPSPNHTFVFSIDNGGGSSDLIAAFDTMDGLTEWMQGTRDQLRPGLNRRVHDVPFNPPPGEIPEWVLNRYGAKGDGDDPR